MRAFVYVCPLLFSIVAAIFEATKNTDSDGHWHENLSSAIFINTSQNSFDLAEHLIQLVENDTSNITDVKAIFN
jgi:hypothetical protein